MHPAEYLSNQCSIWEANPLADAFAALARKGRHELRPRSEQVSINCNFKKDPMEIHKGKNERF